jgi:hypothetical protein
MNQGGVTGEGAALKAEAKRHIGDFAEWGDADYSAGGFDSQTTTADQTTTAVAGAGAEAVDESKKEVL